MENITFTFHSYMTTDQIGTAEFYTYFENETERDAFFATMPKSLKASAFKCTFDNVKVMYGITVYSNLNPKKNNEKNETGIKRFLKFVELYGNNIICKEDGQNLDLAIALVNKMNAN